MKNEATPSRSRRPGGSPVKIRRLTALLALPFLAAGCDLDLTNPNAPTEEEVLTTIDGVVSHAVGMQEQFAGAMHHFVQGSALATDEWGTNTPALASYIILANGPAGALDPAFLLVEQAWASAYRVVSSADNLLEAAPQVGLGPGLETGIVALAKLHKAMALGMIIQQYEEVPLAVEQDAAPLEPRSAVLAEVLGLLESARSDLQGISDAELGPFHDRVLGAGFDLRNTVDAMLARYYLMAGDYGAAIDAADRVDLDVLSVYTYITPQRNPVENLMLQLNYTRPLLSFAEEAEEDDGRVAYWADVEADPFGGNPPEVLLLPPAKYSSPTDPFPVYLPGEMRLIKAEAYARTGQFGLAAEMINEVRTQAASPVDEPLAGLPPIPEAELDTEEALLDQIAYERRYELFVQGLRWEDTRRLGEARTTTPTLPWFPVPQQECLANPAITC